MKALTQTFNNDRAIVEGWSVSGSYQNCKLGRAERSRQFLSDDEAWSHVINQAVFASDAYHAEALRFVERNNPEMFEHIESHAALLGISGGLHQFFAMNGASAA